MTLWNLPRGKRSLSHVVLKAFLRASQLLRESFPCSWGGSRSPVGRGAVGAITLIANRAIFVFLKHFDGSSAASGRLIIAVELTPFALHWTRGTMPPPSGDSNWIFFFFVVLFKRGCGTCRSRPSIVAWENNHSLVHSRGFQSEVWYMLRVLHVRHGMWDKTRTKKEKFKQVASLWDMRHEIEVEIAV